MQTPMNDPSTDDALDALLRSQPKLRDEHFTHAVMAALPARPRPDAPARSFLIATRAGVVLACLVGGLRWSFAGPPDVETVIASILVAAPVLAALGRLFGPVIPRALPRLPRL